MRERFASEETWLIWNGETTKAARRIIPQNIHRKVRMTLERVVLAAQPGTAFDSSGNTVALCGSGAASFMMRTKGNEV